MPAADPVLTGARVRTLDPAPPEARRGRPRRPDRRRRRHEDDVRDWRGPGTERVDLAGATLMPGLVDAHSHPVWGLEMATGTDLSGVTGPRRSCGPPCARPTAASTAGSSAWGSTTTPSAAAPSTAP